MNLKDRLAKFLLAVAIGLFIVGLEGSALAQTWIELFPVGGPSVALLRELAGSGYDAVNNRLILYGSSNPGVSSGLASEVWVLTNANGLGGTPVWIQLTLEDCHPTRLEKNDAGGSARSGGLVTAERERAHR